MKDIKPNQLVYVKEGEGIVRTIEFAGAKGKPNKISARCKLTQSQTTPGSMVAKASLAQQCDCQQRNASWFLHLGWSAFQMHVAER
jgi:hypothetical protein